MGVNVSSFIRSGVTTGKASSMESMHVVTALSIQRSEPTPRRVIVLAATRERYPDAFTVYIIDPADPAQNGLRREVNINRTYLGTFLKEFLDREAGDYSISRSVDVANPNPPPTGPKELSIICDYAGKLCIDDQFGPVEITQTDATAVRLDAVQDAQGSPPVDDPGSKVS